jgi:uncharacterized 2Fe-2S/4Fe-4S cluster protein (DUF4445 family)
VRWGASLHELITIDLAGALGNYLNIDSARRIGPMEAEPSIIKAAGNTSLHEVKMSLLNPSQRQNWTAGVRVRISTFRWRQMRVLKKSSSIAWRLPDQLEDESRVS